MHEKVCCFTGHRPERLDMSAEKAIAGLKQQIEKTIDDGYTCFISGMQRGVDIWAAELVTDLKAQGKPLKLICACAWDGMENGWEQSWIDRYQNILAKADEVIYVGTKPCRASFFERNHWMVDHSSRIIGVFTGAPGGTKEALWYATNKGLEVIKVT
ncbi:MAG: DUF1273 domain-containing protein [Clostridia bacterium]|nr:DUF1273 domain-containing protein [Clostridia bacterium]